jgi:glycine/D-amino acid oxidase-like deaminating enzyme
VPDSSPFIKKGGCFDLRFWDGGLFRWFIVSTQTPFTNGWGSSPWTIDFRPRQSPLPARADIAIVGAGFTGLAAAAWLRHLDPTKSVVVLESETIGAGASGRSGGMTLSETAAGDLPGLGDVGDGFKHSVLALKIDCALAITGAWEIERSACKAEERAKTRGASPIQWQDSGRLRVTKDVPGGTIDPGMLVSGLARAAESGGAIICENSPAAAPSWSEEKEIVISAGGQHLHCQQLLLATNAMNLEAAGLAGDTEPKFTMAIATEPLSEAQLKAIGLAGRQPFYTIDFPYLWGRVTRTNAVVFGGGLVHVDDWRALSEINVATGEARRLLDSLEARVRKLHPALHAVAVTHRWGGPILFAESMKPIFQRHRASRNTLVLAGYAGHGVALSVYLGCWAAEVLLGRRKLPQW